MCLLLACVATGQVGRYAADKIQRSEREKVPRSKKMVKVKVKILF